MIQKQSVALQPFNGNGIIKCKKLVVDDEVKEGFVVIKDGVIDGIRYDGNLPEGLPLLDVGDKAVLPGLIDPHVHINEPGRTDWEGFETATRAALAGGITSLVDMPLNSSPVTTTVKALKEKRKAAEEKLYTNVGFWGGVVPGNAGEIEELIANGVLGFKAFLTHSGIDDFPNVTEEDLRKVMPVLSKHSLPLLVHCELSSGSPTFTNVRSYDQYLASRPKEWEDRAIALMIRLCEEYDCPVHIVHLSSANSLEPIRRAKEKGLPLTVETAQHYLYFTAEEIGEGRTEFKCAPPIREKLNNDRLWEGLVEGIIDFVATDHSPAPPQLKGSNGDFSKAWGGVASLQLAFPILWSAARTRGIGLPDVIKWLSTYPSRLIGMDQKKGRLSKGYDADLVILNEEKEFEVSESSILHRHKLTPYLHRVLTGEVERSFLKGIPVYDHKGQNFKTPAGNFL